jgi:hypothetical protein
MQGSIAEDNKWFAIGRKTTSEVNNAARHKTINQPRTIRRGRCGQVHPLLIILAQKSRALRSIGLLTLRR